MDLHMTEGPEAGKTIRIKDGSYVPYGSKLLGLCPMCQFDPKECENEHIREEVDGEIVLAEPFICMWFRAKEG